MSQGATYADLRFVSCPPEEEKKSPPTERGASEAEEGVGDAELTYENVRGGAPAPPRPGEEAMRGSSGGAAGFFGPWTLILLGTCLFLLASTIGLRVQYWQVSWQLQQASQDHVAQRDILAEKISTMESQLNRSKAELSSTRQTLDICEADGIGTQEQLQEVGKELKGAKDHLTLLWEEKNRTEEELHQARSCRQRSDCCPLGWEHFQQKCLWFSLTSKSWEDSKKDCEKMSSQLLVLKERGETEDLWDAIQSTAVGGPQALPSRFLQQNGFWIGLREREPSWVWVDDSDSYGTQDPRRCMTGRDGSCGQIHRQTLQSCSCSTQRRYICEKVAEAAKPIQTPP